MTDLAGYVTQARALEAVYLASDDPIIQSGFKAGPERWESERRPLTKAIDHSGSFLDVGCANGYLAECVVAWAAESGHSIVPFGVDIGHGLIEVARRRHSSHPDNFFVGDIWLWEPPQRFDYVYALVDLGPTEMAGELIERLTSWVLPAGRLILGSYGSRSRRIDPVDVAGLLASRGHRVTGSAHGGTPPVASFAWIEA